MQGRKPVPTTLKILRGNPGKRPLNDREPRPTRQAPDCPAHLDAEAKVEWARICAELDRAGLLALVDRAVVAAYCQAHAELVWATEVLEREGRIIDVDVFNKAGEKSGTVRKLHSAVKLQRDAFARVKAYLGEFGLTPATRGRLSVAAEESPKSDGKSRFFRSRDADADPVEKYFS